MRSFTGLLTLLLISACPKPGEPIDPATATAKDVEGWWLVRSDGGESTVIGLLSESEARRQLPVDENGLVVPAGQGVSTSYTLDGWGAVLLTNYVATWRVAGGQLTEQVLADRDGPRQATWTTDIKTLTPRQSIALASTRDATGQRTYRWYERCPAFLGNGWHTYAITPCSPSISQGNAIAFDADGNLHAAVGIFAAGGCLKPSYALVTKGCEPRRAALPNFSWSALDVRDGIVRLALVTATAQLLVLEGPVGALTFKQSLVDNGPVTAHGLRFLPGAERPTLLVRADQVNGEPVVTGYSLEAGAWQRRSGAQPPFTATVAPSGDVVFVKDFAVHRTRLDGTPVGAPVPLSRQRPVGPPPLVTADGRVQVVLTGRDVGDGPGGVGGRAIGKELVFAEWDGQRWREVPLGLGYEALLVTAPGGRPRVIASLEKASSPGWVLYELDGGAIASSERIFGPPSGIGATPDFRSRPQAVVDAAGAIGFSPSGAGLFYRAEGPLERKPASVTLSLRGTGSARVVSADGRVDCRDECVVSGLAGERLLVTAMADRGNAVRLPCVESSTLGQDRCFLDLTERGGTLLVDTMKTPYERTLAAGNRGGTALASRASSRGDRALLQANFAPGVVTFAIGPTELSFTRPTPRALVGFDRATGTGWMTPLPEDALALQALPEGGGWVVLAVSGVVELGGRSLGAENARQVLRVRVDGAGQVTDAALLAEGSGLSQLAAAVGPDGSAVVAFRAPGVATAQVARLDASGGRAQGSLGIDAAPRQAWVDGERALVAAGSSLVSLQGPAVAGSRAFPATVTVNAAALHGGRAVVAFTLAVDADLGGGSRPAGPALAQYSAALALTDQAGLSAAPVAVAAFADGVVAMLANQATGGTWSARFDARLAQVGPLEDLGLRNVQLRDSSQDEDGLVLLGLQTGLATLDGFRVTGEPPRTWLIEVRR